VLNVGPRHAVNDTPDQRLINTKHGRNLALRNAAFGEGNDSWNVGFGELGKRVFRSEDKRSGLDLITDVFFGPSKVEVVGINAGAVVALVQNVKRAANLSTEHLPRKTVRGFDNALDAFDPSVVKESISGVEPCPAPNPTRIRFLDLRKKPFYVGQFNHRQVMMTQGESLCKSR
jgi:hypothetical protein